MCIYKDTTQCIQVLVCEMHTLYRGPLLLGLLPLLWGGCNAGPWGVLPIENFMINGATPGSTTGAYNSFYCPGSQSWQSFCGYYGCSSGCQDWHAAVDNDPLTLWNWGGCSGSAFGISSCSFEIRLSYPSMVDGFYIQQSGYANRDLQSICVSARDAQSQDGVYSQTQCIQIPTVTANSQYIQIPEYVFGTYILVQFTPGPWQPYIYQFQPMGFTCSLADASPNWFVDNTDCSVHNQRFFKPIVPTSVTSSLTGFYCTSTDSLASTCGGDCPSNGCNDVTQLADGNLATAYNAFTAGQSQPMTLTFNYATPVSPNGFHLYFPGDGGHERAQFTITGKAHGSSTFTTLKFVQSNVAIGGWQNFSLNLGGTLYDTMTIGLETGARQPFIYEAGFDALRTPCPAGYIESPLGTCVACGPGTYAGPGNPTVCTSCPAGTYGTSSGATACTGCAAGTYSTAVGATAATPCTGCSGGVSAVGASACSSYCTPGYRRLAANSAACVPCAVGTHRTYASLETTCDECVEGSIAPAVGTATCAICPAGTFAQATGMSICTACAAGKYVSRAGQPLCSSCHAGSYSATSGATTCTLCAAGTFQGLDQSTSCVLCYSNYYIDYVGATVYDLKPCWGAPAGATACPAH